MSPKVLSKFHINVLKQHPNRLDSCGVCGKSQLLSVD